MAFQKPAEGKLTDAQERVLAQFGAMKSLLSIPTKKIKSIPKAQQISTFDYLTRFSNSILGDGFIVILLKRFLETIFDPNSRKLEGMIVKSLGKSLNESKVNLSTKESNQKFLERTVLPELHDVMRVAKPILVAKIIALIFGKKDKLEPQDYECIEVSNALFSLYNDNEPTNFSDDSLNTNLSSRPNTNANNNINNQINPSDVEFETNQLTEREQFENGEVVFIISCQKVKIKLPDYVFQSVEDVVKSSQKSNPNIPGGRQTNPAAAFDIVSNYVGQETQRINSPANTAYTKKEFEQILVEKTFSFLPVLLIPILTLVLKRIFDKIEDKANNINFKNNNNNNTVSPTEEGGEFNDTEQPKDDADVFNLNFKNTSESQIVNEEENNQNKTKEEKEVLNKFKNIDIVSEAKSVVGTAVLQAALSKQQQAMSNPLKTFISSRNNVDTSDSIPNVSGVVQEFTPSPCELKSSVRDKERFKRKSAFYKFFLNLLYAFLITLILQRLIKEAKKLVQGALSKKAANKSKRITDKLKSRLKTVEKSEVAGKKVEASKKAAESLKNLSGIFKFGEDEQV
jgi:hypothetical protein